MTDYASDTPIPMLPETFAWIVRNGLYFHVVATSIVLYDHLTTLDLEVELVWKKKISLVQILYFINRYTGDALFLYGCVVLLWSPDPELIKLCASFPQVQTWLAMISLNAMQAIMVHRIVSMYRRQRKVLIGLLLGLALLFVTALVTNVQFTLMIIGVPATPWQDIPLLRTCIPIGFPTWSTLLWFLIIAFDVAIFLLAVCEGLRYRRDILALPSARRRSDPDVLPGIPWIGEGTLIWILLRDSIVFPFLSFLISLFAILSWYKLPPPALQILMNIAAISSPVLGCRLILNLRDAYYRPFAVEIRQTTMEQKTWPVFDDNSESYHENPPPMYIARVGASNLQ